MTTEELRNELGATPADDAILAAAWARAIAAIEKEVDWYFGPPRNVVERLSGGFGRAKPLLILRQYAVNNQAVVNQISGPTLRPIDSGLYEVKGRRLEHDTFWPMGDRNLRIEYQEGFVTLPGDVAQLALEMVRDHWLRKGSAGNGEGEGTVAGPIVSAGLGDYSFTRANLLAGGTSSAGGAAGIESLWNTVSNNWRRGRI